MRRDVVILSSNKAVPEPLFYVLPRVAVMVVEECKLSKEPVRFETNNFELWCSTSGKYYVIGGFAGQEFEIVYADDHGLEVRVRYLADLTRIATGPLN